MDEITGTDRVAEGILLMVKTGSGERRGVFPFSELIDSQVNALHLLQFPHKYLCDPETRVIVRKQWKKI
jgi:hypothetical protein